MHAFIIAGERAALVTKTVRLYRFTSPNKSDIVIQTINQSNYITATRDRHFLTTKEEIHSFLRFNIGHVQLS